MKKDAKKNNDPAADSVLLFKKLYNKSYNNQLDELLDYLNNINSHKRFRSNYIIPNTQFSFNVNIYEGKQENSKHFQEVVLLVFKFGDLEEGSITVQYRDKDDEGNFIEKHLYYPLHVVDNSYIEFKYNVKENEKAFKHFIDLVESMSD